MLELSASEDQIARLRLIRSENIGPVTYFQLLARFGSASAALDAVPDLAARGGGRAPRLASRAAIEREVEQVAKFGARYLFLGQGLYPPLLAEIETAPPALIVKGHVSLLDKPAIAMVGARNASAAACRFARTLAQGSARPAPSSSRASPAASTRPRMTGRWKPARSPSSPAASTSSIRPKTRSGSAPSPNAAC